MPRRHERQMLLMALMLLGMTGLAVRRSDTPTAVDQGISRALMPVQQLLTGASARVSNVVSGVRELDTLRERNASLKARNDTLEVENAKIEELTRENQQLRSELGFARERVDLDLSGASVVGRKAAEEPGSLLHTIRIDIGSHDGVGRGMPVATNRGLVGQLARTGNYWSDVRLITDPASAVWGRIQRSRETGMVFGSTTGELVMRFIPQAAPGEEPVVAEGDLVYTAGLSHQYPPSILIGQVVAVHQSDERTHQEAVIRPSVNFSALELVLVIDDWLPASEPAAESAGTATGH